jgi:hypothetical protein
MSWQKRRTRKSLLLSWPKTILTVEAPFRLVAHVPSSGQFDGERMMGLATVSKAARVERNRLTRKLQLERHEEDTIVDKVFVARNPKRDTVRYCVVVVLYLMIVQLSLHSNLGTHQNEHLGGSASGDLC